jgi:hypothetical protein
MRWLGMRSLLNASHPDVSYGMSVDEVVAALQTALSGGDIEGTKNRFDTLNNAGCRLSNDDSF